MDVNDNKGNSVCGRCGARFGCAPVDGLDGPCWCTALPPALPVPGQEARCWCPACLRAQIDVAKSTITIMASGIARGHP